LLLENTTAFGRPHLKKTSLPAFDNPMTADDFYGCPPYKKSVYF